MYKLTYMYTKDGHTELCEVKLEDLQDIANLVSNVIEPDEIYKFVCITKYTPPTGHLAIGNLTSFNFIEEQWNAETSYMHYDVVRDAQGKSYIAIKPMVPAGTPLTDGEHWFLWSEPDVQLEENLNLVPSKR